MYFLTTNDTEILVFMVRKFGYANKKKVYLCEYKIVQIRNNIQK